MKRNLPNLLSETRIVLAPVLVAVAWIGDSRLWFVVLFVTGMLTDAFDGLLARRWHVQSDLGRRLDSWGDYVIAVATVAGIWKLWPDLVHEQWPWFLTALAGWFTIVLYGLARWGRVLGYHTWMAKSAVVLLSVSVIVLLTGGPAWPFHGAVILQLLCGIEEMAIAFVLPGYSGSMPSLWHALRRRQSRWP